MSDWKRELRELRAHLGATKPMRVRWRWKTSSEPEMGWAWKEGFGQTLVLALYPPSAASGDRAAVEVEVESSTTINDIAQGSTVQVAGSATPGHAAVVIVNGHEYWPTYPCTLTIRTPRL